MLRRSIALLLAIAIAAGMLPGSAWAEGEPTEEATTAVQEVLEDNPAEEVTVPPETTPPPVEEPPVPAAEETTAPPAEEEAEEETVAPTEEPATIPTEAEPTEEETTPPAEEAATVPAENDATVPTEAEATVPTEEETTAPTEEEATVPTEEEATVPTEAAPTAPTEEETTAPTEEEIDPTLDPEESEPVEEAPEEPEIFECSVFGDESEERFEGFLYKLFFGDSGASTFAILAREHLGEGEKFYYDALKDGIIDIAMGNRSSTIINVTVPSGGYTLGDVDINAFTRALVHDFPFETYWYYTWSARGEGSSNGTRIYQFKMQPWPNFRPSDYDENNPTIITTKAKQAVAAANNAKAIVEQYAGYADYNKLCAYADKICSLVSYDYSAANNSTFNQDISPWTLVNVFDGDSSTNVVCEGYSEAFQYLCDCSSFQQDIECYSPCGNNHKWNIVRINGVSYLMDVTHCDSGSYAARGPKFLGGGTGSVEKGYVIGGFNYCYYDDTKVLFGTGDDSILKLSPTKYDPNAQANTMTQAELEQALAEAVSSYTLTKNVTLESDLLLDGKSLVIGSGGSILVPSCVTLQVVPTATLSIQSGGKFHLEEDAVLVSRKPISGISGTGTVYKSDSEYLHFLAGRSALTAQQIRAQIQGLDHPSLMTAMGQNLSGGTGILTDLETLERRTGGAVKVNAAEPLAAYGLSGLSVLGGNLNRPSGSDAITLSVEPVSGSTAAAAFRLSLSGTTSADTSEFPLLLRVTLPRNLDSSLITVTQTCGGSSRTISAVPTARNQLCIVTDTLGEFTLSYPTSGTWNNNIKWTFSQATGELKLSGTGVIPSVMDQANTPWAYYLEGITTVTISQGITGIGNYAFCSAPNLRVLSLPQGLTAIGGSAFEGCTKLTQLTLPDSLTAIGSYAFLDCSGLTELVLPKKLATLGNLAFGGCTGMKQLCFLGSAPTASVQDGDIFAGGFWETDAVAYYPAEDSSWENAIWLECDNSLTWKPCRSGTCGSNLSWFLDVEDGALTITGSGTMYSYSSGAPWQGESIQSIRLDSHITAIGTGAFAGLTGLTEITIPDNVTRIGSSAFRNCSALQTVSLPQSKVTIEAKAFEGSGLTGVDLEYVAAVGSRAFADCAGLKTLNFGSTAPTIAQDAFSGVSAVAYYPQQGSWNSNQLQHYGGSLFWVPMDGNAIASGQLCTSLFWSVSSTGSLTLFGSGAVPTGAYTAWADLSSEITALTMSQGITEIQANAFRDMPNLRTLTAESISSIEANAFPGCTGLQTISLSGDLKLIPAGTFAHCTSIQSVSLPGTLEQVDPAEFGTDPETQFRFDGSVVKFVELFGTGRRVIAQEGSFTAIAPVESGIYALSQEGTLLLFGSETIRADAIAEAPSVQHVNVLSGAAELALNLAAFPAASQLSIPATVTAADLRPNSALTRIQIPDLDSWAKIDFQSGGNPLNSQVGLYIGSTRVTDGSLSASCTKIGSNAFSGAVMNSLFIPRTVESIGENAFQNSRMTLRYQGTSQEWMALTEGDVLPAVCLADGTTLLAYGACGENLRWKLTGDGALTVSGTGSMEDYSPEKPAPWEDLKTGIQKFAAEQGVTRIGSQALNGCGSLKTLVLADSVTEIGSQAFGSCAKLSQLTLSNSLARIESGAFQGCVSLGRLQIPQSVTFMGSNAFADSLMELVIVTNLERWCAIEFESPQANPLSASKNGISLSTSGQIAATVTLPANISAYAFAGCKGLSRINLPLNARIGYEAFSGCTKATLYYPGSLSQLEATGYSGTLPVVLSDGTRILGCGVTDPQDPRDPEASFCGVRWSFRQGGDLRFSGSGELRLNDKQEIPWACFAGQITRVVVDAGVTGLSTHSFDGLTAAKTVVIGPDVANIEDDAIPQLAPNATVIFQGCPGYIGENNFTGQTLWAYYRPTDGWTEEMLRPAGIFWLPYSKESVIPSSYTGFTLTARVSVPSGGLRERESTTIQAFGPDKTLPLNPGMLDFSIPETQKPIAAVGETGTVTAGSRSGSAAVTVSLKNDPRKRKASVTVKCLCAPAASLLLVPGELVPGETEQIQVKPIRSDGSEATAQDAVSWYNVYVNQDQVKGESLCFRVRPELINTLGGGIPLSKTTLKWSTTDSRVATISVNTDGSAVVTIRSGAVGACGINAMATDGSKVENCLTIHVQNYAPKLSTGSFTLNSYREAGVTAILSESYENHVIGGKISLHEYSKALRDYSEEPSPRFQASFSPAEQRLDITAGQVVLNGTYKLQLRVGCENGQSYAYPITVKVANTLPSVTVKQSGKFNLFYKDSTALFTLAAGKETLQAVTLKEDSTNSFVGSFNREAGLFTLAFSQDKQDNPAAKLDTTATLSIQLEGYRMPVRKNITILTQTVKPKLSLQPTSSIFNTAIGSDFSTVLQVYDSTAQSYVTQFQAKPASFFTLEAPDSTGSARLTLNQPYTKGTVTLVVQPDNWMQPVTLTHKVSVKRTPPAVSVSKGTLVLDRMFPDREDSAVIKLDQSNLSIGSVTISSEAKADSAAVAEAAKLKVVYDAKTASIRASIDNPNDAPKVGTYTFRYVVTLNDAKATKLAYKTFKVQVKSSVPSFKLSTTTLKLNRLLGNSAYAETRISFTANAGFALDALQLSGSLDGISLSYSEATGILAAQLTGGNVPNQKQTVTLIPVVRRLGGGEQITLWEKPIKLTLQVYSSTPKVTLSKSGSLDTLIPGKAITYSVRYTNLAGAVEAARLEGESAQLFRAQVDPSGSKVLLTIAEGARCTLKTTYKLTLTVTIRGREYPVPISFQVSQSSLKCTAGSLTLYQSQSTPLSGAVDLQSPAGAEIESIRISSKTDAWLRRAIGSGAFTVAPDSDGHHQAFTLHLANPGCLTRGKSYALYLEVIPKGSATNASPTTVKVTVNVR